jgi:hypothetical protein
MKANGGMDLQTHVLLTSALAGDEQSASCPGHFTHKERAASNHWIGGWVGPRIDSLLYQDLNRHLCCVAHSQSLY